MNFGNEQFGCDEEVSIGIIKAFLDGGNNFIDTANVYSGTKSETIVGKAVKGRRDSVVIATKAASPLGTPNASTTLRANIATSRCRNEN
jgi:aryl-alcohol dehydrogenase-like predicted oxidoreductase